MNSPTQTTLSWRKSSHSNGTGGECVEVASAHGRILVRDSKNPGGTVLTFRNNTLDALFSELRANGR